MKIPDEARLTLSELLPLSLDAQIMGITSDGMIDSLRLVCQRQLAKAVPIIEAQARKEERGQAEKTWAVAYEEGRKAGRKEVVEWVGRLESRDQWTCIVRFGRHDWQSQLKEWGIEEKP